MMLPSSPRLRFRPFVPEDWHDVLAYQSNGRFARFSPWTFRTATAAQSFVQTFVDWQQEEPRYRYQFALTLPERPDLIGNCGIRLTYPGSPSADLGYEFNPFYWGRGYATEAARAMLAFGFQQLALDHIWAMSVVDNAASVRVLQKIGMTEEQQLPRNKQMKGRWWDVVLYSITRAAWQANGQDVNAGI